MDGIDIINSFEKEIFYEFSEAIPILNDEIYMIFKVDIISIEANPTRSRMKKIKKLISSENENNLISYADIEPIAYLLKTMNDDKYDYQIEAIDEKYDSFIEKNKNMLLEEFKKKYPT